ncbi:MAG: hypothetical protein AAB581_01410 [Patescibacteria group bacterium]
MKKVFFMSAVFACSFVFTASFALAHGGAAETGSHGATMMQMDGMMNGMMADSHVTDCATLNSDQFMEKGEELMGRMMGGDAERHERIEQAMETESPEFHDMMHLMMGRVATSCFTDEEQGHIAQRLGVSGVTGQADRSSQWPAAFMGLVIGLIVGMVAVKFFFTKGA